MCAHTITRARWCRAEIRALAEMGGTNLVGGVVVAEHDFEYNSIFPETLRKESRDSSGREQRSDKTVERTPQFVRDVPPVGFLCVVHCYFMYYLTRMEIFTLKYSST